MKILIVEDEVKIARSIKKGLQQEKYIADIANTGDEGFDLASTEDYDLIILDLMLPGMNGLEIAAQLRLQNVQTPILMLTAKSELEDKISGFKNGADDYLTKPFAFEELLARIKALMKRPKNLGNEILKCCDLEIDLPTVIAKRAGEAIKLSKKEFLLLEYLIRNKGKVVTKDQIINNVWEYDSDILPNTVEQYIKYLRTKIDKNFPTSKPLIHTLRGFGYLLTDQNV